MSANDAARVAQHEFESRAAAGIKTEAASAAERTPFRVSDILTSTEEDHSMAAAAASNGFEAAGSAAASNVAESEEAMTATRAAGSAAGNASGYAAVASPNGGDDGELGA